MLTISPSRSGLSSGMPWQTTWLIEVHVAAIIEGRGQGAVVHAELEHEAVDGVGRYPGTHNVDEFIEATRGQIAGLAHARKGFLIVQADLAGVA
jgi:hypothetical protein